MNHRPTTGDARTIARRLFGVDGEAAPLPGEFDWNYRVQGSAGDFVLKLGSPGRRPVFELITTALIHLEGSGPGVRVPRVVPPGGAAPRSAIAEVAAPRPTIAEADLHGEPIIACACTYIGGIPLAELRPRSMAVLESLGALLAELDAALTDFEHPALARDFPWRMDTAAGTVRARLGDLATGRDLVAATLERAVRRLDPVRGDLPSSTIHNDANDYNVIVVPSLEGARLAGLIDFGDVVRGWRVAEIAVAATYAMMGLPDPLEAGCAIVRGYASVAPVSEAECTAIVPIVALRLCLSVCVQAGEMRRQPDNAYLAVSQESAWELLGTLARTDWRIAEFRIREAAGLPPNPGLAAVAPPSPAAPVMAPDVLARPHTIDLSVGSPALPHPGDLLPEGALDRWVVAEMAAHGATVGVGRYGEARLLYDAPDFHAPGNDGPEARTIHLGLDLFAPPGTPVHSPLAGVVVSVADNDRPRDYGPTVILRHEPAAAGPGSEPAADAPSPHEPGFHTLYGHLDHATLAHLEPGRHIAAGDVIGWLGGADVNGGWPPHLHFQVIALDPLCDDGIEGADPHNFPGVALQRLRTVWESVLPDPSALAGLPPGTVTATGTGDDPVLRKRDLAAKRTTVLGSSLSLSYDDPIHMVRGLGAYLYDNAARRYLDTVNNVPHVGHGNRRVAEAIARHSRLLNTNTRYLHGEIVALAGELLAHFPAPLEVVFLVCSGSEANELALRMARNHTGNDGVVCLEGGYHGNTGGLVEVSQYKFDGPGGRGPSDRVAVAPMPDVYRGRYRRGEGLTDDELARRYAGDVARAATRLAASDVASAAARLDAGDMARAAGRPDAPRPGPGVAAFIAEPILSCGGQIEPPPGYLDAAFRHIRRAGGVCIADEVQVGFGRVGDAFWGFELQVVVPDIVTLGKPMGNGHPVAAVVTTREIADSFANGMEYFSTFGGNPVSCAAARAVLAEIRDRGLQERARTVGGALLRGLREITSDHPIVGDVRGRGLFLGIEFVRDRASREPFPEACSYLVNRAREMGVLLSVDGPAHNVIKIKPPLVFGEAEAGLLLETLAAVLNESALLGFVK
ncbi:MAG: aminotransferase class III-fold pyridoxal phosphate-dependent enzyme [Gemmatimonadota bacterium]|nr:aminotransferase class III-fold pyridoxal phosphate-dependent enzyme [Gemmatimonadota bacterium]